MIFPLILTPTLEVWFLYLLLPLLAKMTTATRTPTPATTMRMSSNGTPKSDAHAKGGVSPMPLVVPKSFSCHTLPVLARSCTASKCELSHAAFPVRVLLEEEKRMKPSSPLPWAVFPVRVLPLEAVRRIPRTLSEAVLPVRVLLLERRRWRPCTKPVTWQFLTVTPVLPSRRMPVPGEAPDPMTEKPAQSKVMPSAPMTMWPVKSALSVMSVVMVRVGP